MKNQNVEIWQREKLRERKWSGRWEGGERERERERKGKREGEKERKNSLYLPQVQSDDSKVLISIEELICLVFWVGDLRVDPLSLVVGVVNLGGLPVTYTQRYTHKHRNHNPDDIHVASSNTRYMCNRYIWLMHN